MIFTSLDGSPICIGPEDSTDGRPLHSLSKPELLSELHFREDLWRMELERYRQIAEDQAEKLRQRNGDLLLALMHPSPCRAH